MTIRYLVCAVSLSVSIATLTGSVAAKAPAAAGSVAAEEPSLTQLRQTRFTEAMSKVVPAPSATDTCELRLFIEQQPGGKALFDTDANTLRVSVVEPDDAGKYRDGVCIKRVAEPLELPASMLVASANGKGLDRFCSDPDAEIDSKVGTVPVQVCTWSGEFHSARPFTFTLVAAAGHVVSEYVEFARIYRNASLMAAWNKASDAHPRNKVVISGNALRSRLFAASEPPNGAPLDIRIIPVGTTLPGTVDTVVRNDSKEIEERLGTAGKAGANEVLPPDSPARKSLECLKTAVLRDAAQIANVVRNHGPLPTLDPLCNLPLGVTMGTPLSDEYSSLKTQGTDKLLDLKKQAEQQLQQWRDALEKDLPPYVKQKINDGAKALAEKVGAETKKKVNDYLAANPSGDVLVFLESERAKLGDTDPKVGDFKTLIQSVGELAQDADAQIKFALRTLDEAKALAQTLYGKASDIASDPKQQADIFNAVAQSLQNQGDVFEPLRDNPPLLNGEQSIAMIYKDPVQGFMFAPWNGVPVRVGTDSKADFNAGVAIPIIDVLGVRYQWASNRFADFRGALGAGYTSTKVDGVDKSAFLPNVSVGLSTLKFGFGWTVGEAEKKAGDHARVIVGLDLYKLISGNDVEAL